MNKEKMGKFLKKLRKEHGLSLEKLSLEFEKQNLIVSSNAISGWENGKTIPDIDKLNFLATFYRVTIDDILDGEIPEEIDFDEKYIFHREDMEAISIFANVSCEEYNKMKTEQMILIRKTFKKLIFECAEGNINRSGLKELIFLLQNYYFLNYEDGLFPFFNKLKSLRKEYKDDESFWWEVQKCVNQSHNIVLNFNELFDEGFRDIYFQMQFDALENWEKDMVLSFLQRRDATLLPESNLRSSHIKRYEDKFKKKYNIENINKNTISYLVQQGALINVNYLGDECGGFIETRVIDYWEKAHDYLDKPLEIAIKDENCIKNYYIENNYRNRFLYKYRTSIVSELKELGYTFDEMIKLVTDNDTIPDEVYIRAAKKKGLDINRDIIYIKADMNPDLTLLKKAWEDYRKEYYHNFLIFVGNKENCEEDLNNGCFKGTAMETKWEGGITPIEVYSYVISVNKNMSYDDYLSGRKSVRTNSMIYYLDRVTTNEIRDMFLRKKSDFDYDE